MHSNRNSNRNEVNITRAGNNFGTTFKLNSEGHLVPVGLYRNPNPIRYNDDNRVRNQQKKISRANNQWNNPNFNNFKKQDPIAKANNLPQPKLKTIQVASEKPIKKVEKEIVVEEKEKKKKKKKKDKPWYDRVLDSADNVFKSLMPYLPMLLGMGDYQEVQMKTQDMPKSNSILRHISSGRIGNEVPYMHSKGDVVRLQHREYICDVYSSTAHFTASTLSINPGLELIFQWLAPIANQFTSWKMLGGVVDFVSTASDYADAIGLGYVGVAVQRNASDPVFSSKTQMMNSQDANMAKPSSSFATWIECDPSLSPEEGKLYVRGGEIPSDADIKFYDMGRIVVAVGGNTEDGIIVGSLYITYDIELFIPRPNPSATISTAFYNCTGCSNSNKFGTAQVKDDQLSNMQLSFPSQDIFQFPKQQRGVYYVEATFTQATGIAMSAPELDFFNCEVVSLIPPSNSTAPGNTVVFFVRAVIRITADNAGIEFESGTIFTMVGTSTLFVTELPEWRPTSEILDLGGREKEDRYNKFMDKYKNKPVDEWREIYAIENYQILTKIDHNNSLFKILCKPELIEYVISEKMYKAIVENPQPEKIIESFIKILS